MHNCISDNVGSSIYSTVMEKHDSNLKIHYEGWSRIWDCYIDYKKELWRFAQAHSISMRPAHRLKNVKKGDFIDFNPIHHHPGCGWRVAVIRKCKIDHESGQVQVGYKYNGKHQFYWGHLDNEQELAPFTSKTGTIDHPQQENSNLKAVVLGQSGSNILNSGPPYHLIINRDRNVKFPKYLNELIDNKYNIGNKIDVLDIVTQQWKYCTVIDKEDNWIVVHYDGESSRKNEKLHIKRSKDRIRTHAELHKQNQEKEKETGINNNSNNSNNSKNKNKSEKKNSEIKNECRICFDNIINTVCTPCGHASMCRKCSNDYIKQNSECPICRKKFDNVFDFFIA